MIDKVLQIIIPTLEQQKPIIELVDKIIEAKKNNEDTTKLESQIDKLVYNLYDLTEEEVEKIEQS